MPLTIERQTVMSLVNEGAQLVDVLTAQEYEQEHLPGAIDIPLKELTRSEVERRLRHDKPVIVYCHDYT
jgi:rhodanese-related sulfurtransferase